MAATIPLRGTPIGPVKRPTEYDQATSKGIGVMERTAQDVFAQ